MAQHSTSRAKAEVQDQTLRQMVGYAELIKAAGVSRSTIERSWRGPWDQGEPQLPRPSKIGSRSIWMAAAARKTCLETTVWFSRFFFNGTASAGNETVGCVTHVLIAFLDREIEFEPAPRTADTIEATVIGLAAHLLGGGKAIKHGDSIGRSATDKTYVALLERGKKTDVQVYMLVAPD